jgi:hypothetical protein
MATRIALCGPGRCGKDTAADWLAANTKLRYHQSTSQAAADICFKKLHKKYGYKTPQEAFVDRHRHRTEWAEIIWAYNKPDGIRLYRDMVRTNDVLNGIRKSNELHACKQLGLIDLAIWIDRPGYFEEGSMSLCVEECDIILPNFEQGDTFPKHYYEKLSNLAKALGV